MRNHDLVSDGFLTLFELAGFRRAFALGVTAREPDKVEDGNVREPAALIWLTGPTA
jgi:hypothetical protein